MPNGKNLTNTDLLEKKGGGSSKKKIIGVIVAVVVVVAVIAVAISLRPPALPATPSVVSSATAVTGEPFNITLNAGSKFSDITVFFGDGKSTSVGYNGSYNVTVSHTYFMPGSAYVYYVVKYSNGAVFSSSNALVPVQVLPSTSYITSTESLGAVTYNASASSTPLVVAQSIFSPGSHVNFTFGFYNEPSNHNYQVVNQSVSLGSKHMYIPYAWNSAKKSFELQNPGNDHMNYTFSSAGLYVINLTTDTALVNATTGTYLSSSIAKSAVFYDIAVFSNGAVFSHNKNSILTRAELETGSYKTLDPAIAYDSVSLQVIHNVYQQLITYNGSSTSSFVPELVSQLPTTANGGINTNYKNYTVTDPWGTTYAVNITPYENYTFHIRTNASFQNGQPVTAWDAMYSFTRALLFDASTPGTGGWIMAQYLLPGNYYKTNTFWNITQNMTINNATNNITMHFQKPMPPTLVFQLLTASSGFYPLDASWLIAHGAGITWSPAGFQAYKKYGNEANYNTYVQNNVLADGPYEVAYTVPSTEVVLVANPTFKPPGPWFPKPSIHTVILQFTGSQSTVYLEMKSGQAQIGQIASSSWYLTKNLETSGQAKVYGFPALSIFWYNFNANINTTILHSDYSSANVPSNLFTSLNARKAFAYAYNYVYYLEDQMGNAVYNTTFGSAYAGMLDYGMLGYQSIPQLNSTTTGVPYFDLSLASSYWSKVDFSKYGITDTSSGYLYNGKPLVIPIYIPTGDSTDLAGATTWGSDLSTFITGATFPVIATPFPTIIGNQVQGQNPMPIYFLGWGPDYPYPTDYLGPMALPENSTTYPGPNDFTPYYFNQQGHPNQAGELSSMIGDYNNGTSAANTTLALYWFHKMNEELVNLTFYVYLFQSHDFFVTSPNLNGTDIIDYQENVIGAGSQIFYNLMAYNSTSST